jgi:hypothetical protein
MQKHMNVKGVMITVLLVMEKVLMSVLNVTQVALSSQNLTFVFLPVLQDLRLIQHQKNVLEHQINWYALLLIVTNMTTLRMDSH